MKKRFLKLNKDNQGVALLSVMIVLTVALLLATVVLEVTYNSLLARRSGKNSNVNFYEAEVAVSNVENTLQSISAYSANQTATASEKNFVEIAETILLQSANITDNTKVDNADNYGKIADYLFSQMDLETRKVLGYNNGTTRLETGDTDGSSAKFEVEKITADRKIGGSINVKVRFKYEGKNKNGVSNGYLTDISTELIINDTSDRSNPSGLPAASYSAFAGGGADYYNGDSLSGPQMLNSFTQEGNVYIGKKANTSEAMSVDGTMVLLEGMNIFINGDVNLKDHAGLVFAATPKQTKTDDGKTVTENPKTTIRGKIYLDDSSFLTITNGCELVCEDIVLKSNNTSIFDPNGPSYVSFTGYNSQAQNSGKAYYGMFPFPYSKISELKGKKGQSSNNMDWWDKKTGGCVLYREVDSAGKEYSYVVEYTTKKNAQGKDVEGFYKAGTNEQIKDILVNHDAQIKGHEATMNIWTSNDKTYEVDSEFASLCNVPVLEYICRHVGNVDRGVRSFANIEIDGTKVMNISSEFNYDNPTLLKLEDGSGASLMTYTNLAIDNLDISNDSSNKPYKGLLPEATGDYVPVSGLSSNKFPKMTMFYGRNVGRGEVIHCDNTHLYVFCTYDSYIVHPSCGDYFAGLYMTSDKVSFQINGEGNTVAYSISELMDQDEAFAESIPDVLKEMQYTTSLQNCWFNTSTSEGISSKAIKEKYLHQIYSIGSLNSVFINGLPSILEVSDNSGNSIIKTINNQKNFDYVMVQNWVTN